MIEFVAILHPATGRDSEQLAVITITNDGSESDGSGDAPYGNYDVRASWKLRRSGEWRSTTVGFGPFDRGRDVLFLLRDALSALVEVSRIGGRKSKAPSVRTRVGHCEDDCPCRNGERRAKATLKAAKQHADRARAVLAAADDLAMTEVELRRAKQEFRGLADLVKAILERRQAP